MNNTSPLFASAIINARGVKLLNPDRVRRMIDAPTLIDAVKILYECGYNDTIISENPGNIDLLLSDELKSTVLLFTELCTDKNLNSAVMRKYDYHNAKVFMKARYNAKDYDAAVYSFGLIEPDTLKEAVFTDKYAAMPAEMAAAVRKLNKLFLSAEPSGREIDVELDRAMFEGGALNAAKIRNRRIRNYFAAEADTANMVICARCRRLGFTKEEVLPQLIAGGLIPADKMLKVAVAPPENILTAFLNTPYFFLVRSLCERLTAGGDGIRELEDGSAEYLLSLTRGTTVNFDSEEPLFRWYIQKLAEIKTVKLILVSKNMNLPEDSIRARLKRMYL